MISVCKISGVGSVKQFFLKGNNFRVLKICPWRGILLYIKEGIPSKLLKTNFDENTEAMFVEINIRKKKWLISCSYNPHKSEISKHLKSLGMNIDSYSSKYENYILLGDFNAEPSEKAMEWKHL